MSPKASQRDAKYKWIYKILFRSFTLIFQRDILPNVFRRGNDFENRVASAGRSTYPTLIERRPRYRRKEDTAAAAHAPILSLSPFLSTRSNYPPVHRQTPLENLAWSGRHYLFNFRQVGGVVARKAGRPTGRFVFSRLSRGRKMMEVAYGKRGGKKKRRRGEESGKKEMRSFRANRLPGVTYGAR